MHKVIFRKFPEGDIVAFFPFEDWNVDGSLITSYQHVGQHGGADPELIFSLSQPYYNEYEDLLNELNSIGYDVHVMSRREASKLIYKFADRLANELDLITQFNN